MPGATVTPLPRLGQPRRPESCGTVPGVAQFTPLQSHEIAAIANAYGLGAVRTWRGITAGTVNSNFAIETDAGRYFLRVNEGKTHSDVEWEARLLGALDAAAVPIVPVRKTTTSASALPWQCGATIKYLSLFDWTDGVHLAPEQMHVHAVTALGAALAHMHQATVPLVSALGRGNRYDFAEIAQRASHIAALADPELAAANALIASELRLIDAHRGTSTQAIIHGDLFRDNVLWQGPSLRALLDFEQASTGAIAYDIAVCLHDWCWQHGQVEWSLVAALLHGYLGVRALVAGDLAVLPWELRFAAVRFTVTRITDVYLAKQNNPEKDFRAFLARADFWRSADAIERLLQLTNSMVTR